MTGRGAYKPRRPVLSPRSLGQRITSIRVAFGMSQAAFADALGASQQSLGLWETDRSKPSAPAMASLCRLTGLGKEALVEGVGFQVPGELPGLLPVNPRETTREAVVAIEEGGSKPITLPAGRPGEIWAVDSTETTEQLVSPESAAALIKDAAESGAEIWVIVRPKAGSRSGQRNARRKKPLA